MLTFRNFIRRLKSPYNYNIGFVEITPEDLITDGGFGNRRIDWMKHPYSDRWFADPFILDVIDNEITVLAEEKEYCKNGILVKLTVSKSEKKLLDRKEILKLDTHLSYPNIWREDGKIFIFPENSQSGALKFYELTDDDSLRFTGKQIDAPLNDSTIYHDKSNDKLYLLATNTDIDCHNNTQLYTADKFYGSWKLSEKSPIITDARFARPGGDFFEVDGRVYHPMQDCHGEYGNSLHIMEVKSFSPYQDLEVIHIKPTSFKYSSGIHTLNFHKSGVAVVDGNGYAYPIAGRLFGRILEKIIH